MGFGWDEARRYPGERNSERVRDRESWWGARAAHDIRELEHEQGRGEGTWICKLKGLTEHGGSDGDQVCTDRQ